MKIDLSFDAKHALVCGASDGIGRAIARGLAAHGASLTLLARRRERLETLAKELTEAGAPKVRTIVFDLDERDQLCSTIDALVAESGPVHILINNTGGPSPGPILEAGPEDFQLGLGRHLFASQLLVKSVLPGMREAGFGRIINVISTSVREPIPNLGVSNTVRGAMASWAKTVAGELPPGITINNLLPGLTDTERLTSLRGSIAARTGQSEEAVLEGWRQQVPEGRLAQPEELAAAVVFLASPAASYIRGISLPVDGGRLHCI